MTERGNACGQRAMSLYRACPSYEFEDLDLDDSISAVDTKTDS